MNMNSYTRNFIFQEPELSISARLRLVTARGIVSGEGQDLRDGRQNRAPGGDEGGPEPEEGASADDPMLPGNHWEPLGIMDSYGKLWIVTSYG